MPGSSLVVRAAYGVYRNSNIYQSIATQLAQQPPLSTSFRIGNSPETPLTLADGFIVGRTLGLANALNTFAIDPELHVSYAQNWQASIQRDLPMSLTVNATYLGAKGTNLMQAFVPNTYPVGGVNPCPACPTGFSYLISNGHSIRNAGQVQLRRRLRNGFTSSIQYTLAKAMDNAGSFQGASISGQALAQNWLDLEAEVRALEFRSAPPGGRDLRVHDWRRRARRHAPRRDEGAVVEGLDVHQPDHDGQRYADHADLLLRARRHRHHRQHPPQFDGRAAHVVG